MIKDDLTTLKSENDRLKKENIDLKERLLYMEAKNKSSNTEIIELKERLVEYQQFVKAVRLQQFTEAFEEWLIDEDN